MVVGGRNWPTIIIRLALRLSAKGLRQSCTTSERSVVVAVATSCRTFRASQCYGGRRASYINSSGIVIVQIKGVCASNSKSESEAESKGEVQSTAGGAAGRTPRQVTGV